MSPSGVAHILCDASELAACLRLFSHEPVDVMHVNINEYYEVAGIACKLRGIPCLGMCCAFPGKNEGYRQRHLTRWIPKLHTAVASKSLACINAWQRLCDLSSHKCRFIWNGVDLQKFGYKKREPAAQGRPFRLLAVGRLHPMKGLDVLVRAIRLLRNKDVVLSIAGHGEKQHKEGLERLVSDLNLSSKVRFLGYVEDVVPLYRKTDCTVSASVAHESFGQTLIEAMACGSPLITSDFGPFPEINLHKVTGLVVPAHNTSHLAMAISTMMDEEGFRIQMGRRARERAERLFSQDRMIDKTVDLYAELAENQRQD
ncbi:MAG: glycosyltransferase family 4 protein [Thermodesulfobacteriota bacterium]|nr:glycosyltransferase family 4 protein [Thermodesulfobacteriota bacterium]